MNKTDKNNGIPVKVVDITEKLKDYVTLEEFMKRTKYVEDGLYKKQEGVLIPPHI